MFKIWSPHRIILDKWYACSPSCIEEFAHSIEKETAPSDVEMLGDLNYAIPILVKRTLFTIKYQRKISLDVFNQKDGNEFIVNFSPVGELDNIPRNNSLWQRLLKLKEYYESVQLSNWVKAGRFEDAAIFYEQHGEYEEAGKMRLKGREIHVKNTNVNVDLNALLRQIAEGGIVAVYRCPHCGAKLKVGKETTIASLRTCEHCSSEIETMDMVDFLKTALS